MDNSVYCYWGIHNAFSSAESSSNISDADTACDANAYDSDALPASDDTVSGASMVGTATVRGDSVALEDARFRFKVDLAIIRKRRLPGNWP